MPPLPHAEIGVMLFANNYQHLKDDTDGAIAIKRWQHDGQEHTVELIKRGGEYRVIGNGILAASFSGQADVSYQRACKWYNELVHEMVSLQGFRASVYKNLRC